MKPRVVVVQRVLLHYRVPFFERLKEDLDRIGIDLVVVHGQPNRTEKTKQDEGSLEWAIRVRNRYMIVFGREVVWQPVLPITRRSDLVIVEQASRLLINYVFLLLRFFGRFKMAWWGHGSNLDPAGATRVGERLKKSLVTRVDWWFAYTSRVAEAIVRMKVNPDIVTVVDNSVDTRGAVERTEIRLSQGHAFGGQSSRFEIGMVGVFIGSLYKAKRIGFLIETADAIRAQLPNFELIVIGDGPDRIILDQATLTRPWMQVLGALHGDQLTAAAEVGDVCLNPGLVGLGVLDAFALGLPVVTCDLNYHSPEVAYIQHGVNGLIIGSADDSKIYATAVADLLHDRARLEMMKCAAVATAKNYSLENMVRNFSDGIQRALRCERV